MLTDFLPPGVGQSGGKQQRLVYRDGVHLLNPNSHQHTVLAQTGSGSKGDGTSTPPHPTSTHPLTQTHTHTPQIPHFPPLLASCMHLLPPPIPKTVGLRHVIVIVSLDQCSVRSGVPRCPMENSAAHMRKECMDHRIAFQTSAKQCDNSMLAFGLSVCPSLSTLSCCSNFY